MDKMVATHGPLNVTGTFRKAADKAAAGGTEPATAVVVQDEAEFEEPLAEPPAKKLRKKQEAGAAGSQSAGTATRASSTAASSGASSSRRSSASSTGSRGRRDSGQPEQFSLEAMWRDVGLDPPEDAQCSGSPGSVNAVSALYPIPLHESPGAPGGEGCVVCLVVELKHCWHCSDPFTAVQLKSVTMNVWKQCFGLVPVGNEMDLWEKNRV